MSRSKVENEPVVIEAAVTPLRAGAAIQLAAETVNEAKACLAAGAGIVHYHHDFSLERSAAIDQIIGIGKAVLADYPEALLYPDYLRGKLFEEKHAYLQPLSDAGALRMFAFDPGLTVFALPTADGLPSKSSTAGTTYKEAHRLVEFANRVRAPVSIGVFEPGHLRWIRAYAAANMFPAGSIIKIYFGGEHIQGVHRVPGVTFGLPPTKAALDMYLSMLEGSTLPWVVTVLGGTLLDTDLARYALERGGHLRVGIEDSAGTTDMTNVETVATAISLVNAVGRPVAKGTAAESTLAGYLM